MGYDLHFCPTANTRKIFSGFGLQASGFRLHTLSLYYGIIRPSTLNRRRGLRRPSLPTSSSCLFCQQYIFVAVSTNMVSSPFHALGLLSMSKRLRNAKQKGMRTPKSLHLAWYSCTLRRLRASDIVHSIRPQPNAILAPPPLFFPPVRVSFRHFRFPSFHIGNTHILIPHPLFWLIPGPESCSQLLENHDGKKWGSPHPRPRPFAP